MQLVIGRIGRPHGVRGEVTVEVHTDAPELRFAPGSVLDTDPQDKGPLTIEAARYANGRLLLSFDGVGHRTAAEALRGVLLVADAGSSPPSDDPEEFWDHELVDLTAVTVAGEFLGVVAEVVHLPGGDVLVVRRPDDSELLIPFVAEIVPEVDVKAGTIVVDPPDGLLDLSEA